MTDTLGFDTHVRLNVGPADDSIAKKQLMEIFDAQRTERETIAAVKAEYPNGLVRVFMKSTQREHEFGFENSLRAILRGDAVLITKEK
jgi:hypothetical protein